MVFASLSFLFGFFPLFLFCYFILAKKWSIRTKNALLVLFSLFFYSWGEPRYVVLMIYSSVLDFCCGRMIEKQERLNRQVRKKLWLGISLIGNLGLLFVFKYLSWAGDILSSLGVSWLSVPQLALPIGISFYTFQTMSYSIDVYRGRVRAQRDFISFAAYVTMFPQLIAGPIVRYQDIGAALEDRQSSLSTIAEGGRRFILGLSKKVLLANTMARTADALFLAQIPALGVLGSWTAIIAYHFQIYFDFSGYSDMAIGIGKMLGFRYPENFNYPYIACSVTDFWRRWHMTMGAFFRDYVYIPLGGNRISGPTWIRNMLITWMLTGLWHGASWNYVLWGLYYAALLMLEKLLLRPHFRKAPVVGHVYALLAVVVGWVIFTHKTAAEIGCYLGAMFGAYGFLGNGKVNAALLLQRADVDTLFLTALAACFLFCRPFFGKLWGTEQSAAGYWKDGALILLFFCSVIQLALGAYNPFIYFQF